MALKSINLWQSPDSSRDLNTKLQYRFTKGLLWGGSVGSSASLIVPVSPLVAVNHDGMTVVSDAVENVVVAANTKNVVVLYVKYNELGIPAVPVETITVFDWATYNAHPDKDWLNILAIIDLPLGAVNVAASDIDYTERHEVDPVGRNFIRGITTYALLPTPTSLTNRVDDIYWVSDHQVFYFWNGTAWEAINTGTYNAETTVMNDRVARAQLFRNVEGSGVVAGTRPGDGSFASYRHVDPIETPFVANSMDVDAFSVIINGHYLETHAQTISMPLAADRLDLVYLEVWREDIVTPENQLYDRNPDGTLKYNIQQVDDEEEAYNWVKGIGGNNYDFNTIEVYDHGFRVLKYRFVTMAGVPQIALTNPNDATVVAGAVNVDGAPFAVPPAGSDDRAWIAASGVTPVDGYSWAIPIFAVRRLAAENPGIGEGIKIFRSGIRHVFQIYPICDALNAARGSVESIEEKFPTAPGSVDKGTWDEPSGFLTGMDFQPRAGVAINTLQFYDQRVKIRIRGLEDWFTLPSTDVDLGAAPAAGYDRILVFLKMQITRYNNDPSVVTNYMLSPQHRPYIPSRVGSNFRSQGWVKGFVSYELVVEHLGATNVLDEHDAMLAAPVSPVSGNPWERGDVTAPSDKKYDDGGIWSRPLLELEDDRCHPYAAEWAIPICLVHRRNQGAYDFQSNPNGTGLSRPDDRQSYDVLHPDDLVDLRHQVGLDIGSYKAMIEDNIDLLMKGQLRTRLANKYLGAGTGGTVAGSRILQADIIGNAPGAFQLTAPDGMKRIWSDAREFHIVATTIDMALAGPIVADLYEWQQLSPTEGELIIKAPPGASLVRHLPAQMYVNGNSASASFMDFYGPPCWTTRIEKDGPNAVNPCHSKLIDGSSAAQDMHYWYYGPGSGVQCGSPWWGEPFAVIATDSLGRATQMRGYVDLSDPAYVGLATLSWWVHYDRTFTNTDNYDANYGLAEIPDTIHQATKDPLGAPSQLNIGTLAVTLRKSLVAAASVSFTDAEVAAATGLPGTHTILGFDNDNVSPPVAFMATPPEITDVWDQLTIYFDAPFTGDFEVTIFFETTSVNEWVEVGRGGKSVQALFSWHQQAIDFGGAPVGTEYAYDLGGSIWYPPEIDGRTSGVFPQFWTRTSAVPGTPWVLNLFPLGLFGAGVGTCYSNLVSFNDLGLDQYTTVLTAQHAAPPAGAANHILLEYTYTPYQGQSSEGGESPIIGTALPKLKNLLHGVVEDNSDFYATQSGAASYFSGVLSWTGLPVNNQRATIFSSGRYEIGGLDRFSSYNKTAVVKPTQSEGTFGLNSVFLGGAGYNAAAVLRLPFPTHFNLLSGSYHRGVEDFDLDPVRAGAGAGTLSYAPGYGLPLSGNIGDIRYDHFLNSVAPFSVRGKGREVACNLSLTPDRYQHDFTYSGPNVEFEGPNWLCPNVERLLMYGNIDPGRSAILKRTITQGTIDKIYGSFTITFHVSGLEYYNTETRGFIATFGSPYSPADYLIRPASLLSTAYPQESSYLALVSGLPVRAAFTTCPGEIDYFYKRLAFYSGNKFVTPVIELYQYPSGGVAAEINDTDALLDTFYSPDSSFIGLQNIQASYVDVVKVPLSSSGSQRNTYVNYPEPNVKNASGKMSLQGVRTSYPPNWSVGDIATLEGLMLGAQDLKGAGRGIFIGDVGQNARFAMPVLVPGTGADLTTILKATSNLLDSTAQSPPNLPTMPGEPLFDDTNRLWMQYDHGGPIAYVFMGLFVNPEEDDYKNRLVLQISGGPTGTPAFPGDGSNTAKPSYSYSPETIEATALDAFWPKGRPLLSSGKKK